MSRSWHLFLFDMLESARKIVRYSAGRSFAEFVSDELIYDAVLRNLEVLGEAAKRIPGEVQAAHPEVDWRGVGGLRDVLAHAYFALDDATVWKIVREDVPELLAALERIADAL